MKKIILFTAILITMAQADMCKVYTQLSFESFQKAKHFEGKDKQRMCYEISAMMEHALSAKITCKDNLQIIGEILQLGESMNNKLCKGKKI